MSSPSNKPYKSRLLNFLNRYFIKLNSEVSVKFRELGYVLQGGLQTVMLPLLWAWKSTSKIGQFLTSSGVKTSSLPASEQIQSHPCDYLIEAVNRNLAGNPLFSSLLPANYQGLASRLKNRSIVVIGKRNRIKKRIPKIKQDNIKFVINHTLNNQQKSQDKLAKQVLNFTNIFPSKKQNNLDLQTEDITPSTIATNNSNQLVNFADNLFARIESLVVRKQANNQLVVNTAEQSQQILVDQEDRTSLLVLIQQAIAHFFLGVNNKNKTLEGDIQQEVNSQQITGQKIQSLLPAINHKVVEEIIPLVQNKTAQIVVKGINKIQVSSQNINQSLNNQNDPFQIKILILEAFNYFVQNQLNNKLFNQLTSTEVTIIDEDNDQPWLSWEDLYGTQPSLSASELDASRSHATKEAGIEKNNTRDEEDSAIIIEEYTIPSNLADTPESIISDKVKDLDQEKIILSTTYSDASEAIEQEKSSVTATTTVIQTESFDLTKVAQTKLTQDQVTTVEQAEAEAIETKVIEIKYEKHLLETILEKLDLIIVWLEEKIIKLIQAIKTFVINS